MLFVMILISGLVEKLFLLCGYIAFIMDINYESTSRYSHTFEKIMISLLKTSFNGGVFFDSVEEVQE